MKTIHQRQIGWQPLVFRPAFGTFLALVLVLVCPLAGCGWLENSGPPDPRYEGRRVSAWVRQALRHDYGARQAILRLGALAVPSLIRELQAYHPYQQSLGRKAYATFFEHAPAPLLNHLPAPVDP